METGSYLLAGVASGGQELLQHGARQRPHHEPHAGRASSCAASSCCEQMAGRGILVRAASLRGLAEEAGFAYKSVDEVAEATELAGLSKRVARLVPVGNVKG